MFVAVCAISDEVAEIKKHSGIYWSGESQAPFTEVWLVTAASADELEAWAKSTLPEASFFEIDRPSLPGELSALSCSEWAFRS
ncbi:MAG: hypothetical protein JWR75_1480 [Devosia sp.]|nr:hypothetical protein [Devosia sp.]